MKTGFRYRVRLVLVLSGLALSGVAWGDELTDLKAQWEKSQQENKAAMEQLLNRVNALEDQNKTLSRELEDVRTKPAAAAEDAVPVVPAQGLFGQRVIIQGYGDMTYQAGQGARNTFTIGQFDLFMTSQLADQLSFLSELVVESGDDNAVGVDLERIQLKYSPSDLLNIAFGRFHTPLGYWNQTFHHGAWFQTTIFRPEMYKFEDDAGILPIHSVGLQLSGSADLGAFDVEYNFGVANGRGKIVDEVQNVQDRNGSKSVNILLAVAPHGVPGLKLAFNTYLDTIPPDKSDPARTGSIDERIFGGAVTYQRNHIELLGELSAIHHHDQVSDRDFDTWGAYVQAAYQCERWKPYYRFDYIEFGQGDPFYGALAEDIRKHTIGVRWDPFQWMGLKLEYSHTQQPGERDHNAVAVQSAFTF